MIAKKGNIKLFLACVKSQIKKDGQSRLSYNQNFIKNYAENEVPQPQPPVAFGFSKVKPEPIIFDV